MFVPPKSNFLCQALLQDILLVNCAKKGICFLYNSTEKHVFVKESVSETGLLNPETKNQYLTEPRISYHPVISLSIDRPDEICCFVRFLQFFGRRTGSPQRRLPHPLF